jgi:hypothetical protein
VVWSPRQLILLGALVIALAVALAAVARALRGPFNPECEGFCLGVGVLALQWAALPLAIFGAVLVGIGIARRDPPPENVQEAPPRSPPR